MAVTGSLLPAASPGHSPVKPLPLGAPLVRLAILGIILAAVPLAFTNSFHFEVATHIVINAIVCVGLNLLAGYAGQISLGHAAFFGLGAYGTALIPKYTALIPGYLDILSPILSPIPAAFLAAAAVGAFAAAVARPILRLRGHYLAMATLGLGVIVSIVLKREIDVTGGPDGLSVSPLVISGVKVRAIETWYAVAAIGLMIAVFLAENLINSPYGRALRALHSSEIAAATSGIDVARAKARVFALSAVYASLAGSLFAFSVRFITPADADFLLSVDFLTMIVLGGLGSTYGAVAGAVILTPLPQVLPTVAQALAAAAQALAAVAPEFAAAVKWLSAVVVDGKNIAIGLVLILTMVFMPRGVVPSLAALVTRGLFVCHAFFQQISERIMPALGTLKTGRRKRG
jgi:branched-chain amino acid transport system permease protein